MLELLPSRTHYFSLVARFLRLYFDCSSAKDELLCAVRRTFYNPSTKLCDTFVACKKLVAIGLCLMLVLVLCGCI